LLQLLLGYVAGSSHINCDHTAFDGALLKAVEAKNEDAALCLLKNEGISYDGVQDALRAFKRTREWSQKASKLKKVLERKAAKK
jgi:hypothetical protein